MLFSSIFVCIGQLFWKLSAEKGLLILFLGFVCYGIGALLMLVAYRFGKLSVLQPMLSLNYVLSIILAALVLNEQISLMKGIGVFVIIAGVILIAGGMKNDFILWYTHFYDFMWSGSFIVFKKSFFGRWNFEDVVKQ